MNELCAIPTWQYKNMKGGKKMKKLISLFIALMLVLFFVGCIEDTSYDPQNKARWIKEALETVKDNPEIKAICYWHEEWEQYGLPANLKISSSDEALNAYKSGIADEYFISAIQVDSNMKILPPTTGTYHCAYPGFSEYEQEIVTEEKIKEFETLAGKRLTWVYFSDDWSSGISFPSEEVNLINGMGRVPFIRMMAWSAYQIEGEDPVYKMQSIIDGDFNAEITQWALDAKATNKPMMIEFGTEVNGDWFPWNGRWNGGGTITEYGDPELPDGPERFRDAYRHIIDLFRAQNVTNVTWAFHVNAISIPDESWNNMKAYYPGDDYIDWIGISIYGPINKNDPDKYSFREILEYVYSEFSSISTNKPLAVFEYGVGEY